MLNAPILLLPGMMMDHRMWAAQTQALAPFHECHAGVLTRAESMEGLAEDLLGRHEGPLHVAGFSLGAIVAMAMWRIAPARIRSLVLIGFNPRADDPRRATTRQAQALRAQRGELAEIIRHDFAPLYFAPDAGVHHKEAWTEDIVDMATDLGAEVFRRQTAAQLARPDSVPTLQSIDVPTLVIAGQHDALVEAAEFERVGRSIPNARSCMVEGAGHMSPMEQPAQVNRALIRFYKDFKNE